MKPMTILFLGAWVLWMILDKGDGTPKDYTVHDAYETKQECTMTQQELLQLIKALGGDLHRDTVYARESRGSVRLRCLPDSVQP